jgi:hypothetical protein
MIDSHSIRKLFMILCTVNSGTSASITLAHSISRFPSTLLPPIYCETMAWQILPDKFPSRSIRLLSDHLPDLHCQSLHKQVYSTSELLANDLQISVTDAELSSLFGRKGHGREE